MLGKFSLSLQPEAISALVMDRSLLTYDPPS